MWIYILSNYHASIKNTETAENCMQVEITWEILDFPKLDSLMSFLKPVASCYDLLFPLTSGLHIRRCLTSKTNMHNNLDYMFKMLLYRKNNSKTKVFAFIKFVENWYVTCWTFCKTWLFSNYTWAIKLSDTDTCLS